MSVTGRPTNATPSLISGGFLDCCDDLLRSIEDVFGGDERQATFGERLLAGFHIVSFETHDQRYAEVGFARGFNDAMGDDIAIHDPAENIHKDTFDVLIAKIIRNAAATCSLLAPPPTSRKFAGLPPHIE